MNLNGKTKLMTSLNGNSSLEKQPLTRFEQVETIAFHFAKIMEALGLDLDDLSLRDTPMRVAKMYVNETFKGLDEHNFPEISFFENHTQYREMILIDNISLFSYCEHHFVPFFGKASVAYIPQDRVIGLSKINRIVQFFSSKPQIQEKLTVEIGLKLKELLSTEDVAVYIEAQHLCVAARGVKDANSITKTHFFSGTFSEEKEKTRFLNSISK